MKKLIYIISSILVSFNAVAHPHIWVYTDLGLNVKNKQITGLHVKWKFDEMYSAAFLADADLNKDKRLDKYEAEKMQKQVLEKAVTYLTPFIMLKLGGKDIYGYKFDNLNISYNEQSEQIEYEFDVVLHAPRQLVGNHKLAIVDQEFYVGFEQSYDFALPSNCDFDLIEDETISIYEGMVHPEVYQLECK